jgi:hypothetical protein
VRVCVPMSVFPCVAVCLPGRLCAVGGGGQQRGEAVAGVLRARCVVGNWAAAASRPVSAGFHLVGYLLVAASRACRPAVASPPFSCPPLPPCPLPFCLRAV